jgi:His-Xaa-Ser system protein HxsD
VHGVKIGRRIENREVQVEVDGGLYELEAIMQAANRFTDRWFVRIEQISETVTGVFFKPKDDNEQEAEKMADLFLNELIDQQVRLFVQRECGQIRDQIVKKAFSPVE